MDTILIDGKEKKITTRKDGYQMISINRKVIYLHRFLARKYIPNPDNKPCVNHIDGNPSNNSLENLEWVTYLENHIHAKKNKLWGDNILKKRKLNTEIIQEAKQKYLTGNYTYKKLSKEYNVDLKTIYQAINNQSYNKNYI